MSIKWGSWVGVSPKRMRLGIEFTSVPTPPSETTTSVRVTARVWLNVENAFYHGSGNTFIVSGSLGSLTASKVISTTQGGSQNLQELARNVPLNASSPTTVTVAASLKGITYVGAGLTASVTATATIPVKPIAFAKPSVPRNFQITFVNNSTGDLAWDPPVDGPVTRYILERYDYLKPTEGYVYQVWTAGTVFRAANHVGNNRYSWRIKAENALGVSDWVYINDYYTTPAPPKWVAAKKIGTSVRIAWINYSPHATHFLIRDRVNGGDPAIIAVVPDNPSDSYTYEGASLEDTHEFEVRAQIGSMWNPISGRYSPFSEPSPTLRVSTPPSAPTPLSPTSGAHANGLNDTTFRWKHNPLDTSDQVAARVRWRLEGGAWNTVTVSGSDNFVTIPIDYGTGVKLLEWEVQTRGAHPTYSIWSQTAAFHSGTPPTVAILSPDPAVPVTATHPQVAWSFADAENEAQTRFQIQYSTPEGEFLSEYTSYSAAQQAVSTYALSNFTAYQLTVIATDSSGLTGSDTILFETEFITPALPLTSVTWDPETHMTTISTTPPAGVPPVPHVSSRIERSTDGVVWDVMVAGVDPVTTVSDALVPFNTNIYYRTIAISDQGAEAYGDIAIVYTESLDAVFNYGPGLTERLVVPCELDLPASLVEHSQSHLLAGRDMPVNIYDLDHPPSRVIELSAHLPHTPVRDLEMAMFQIMAQNVYYRDLHGRAFWAKVTGGQVAPFHGHPRLGCTVTESDGEG